MSLPVKPLVFPHTTTTRLPIRTTHPPKKWLTPKSFPNINTNASPTNPTAPLPPAQSPPAERMDHRGPVKPSKRRHQFQQWLTSPISMNFRSLPRKNLNRQNNQRNQLATYPATDLQRQTQPPQPLMAQPNDLPIPQIHAQPAQPRPLHPIPATPLRFQCSKNW